MKKKMKKNYGLAAFLERHASGETDFHDFVMHAKFKVHKVMIDMGCAIEQFQELDKAAVIVYLIEKGYGQEKYEAWKKTPGTTRSRSSRVKGVVVRNLHQRQKIQSVLRSCKEAPRLLVRANG